MKPLPVMTTTGPSYNLITNRLQAYRRFKVLRILNKHAMTCRVIADGLSF